MVLQPWWSGFHEWDREFLVHRSASAETGIRFRLRRKKDSDSLISPISVARHRPVMIMSTGRPYRATDADTHPIRPISDNPPDQVITA
jgi:hypothetical protein